MLDFDGTFSYSKIIAVNANEKFTVKVYPNPTQHYLTVDINNPTETELVLFDVLGKVVQRITTTTTASNKIPLQNLAKGMYHIQLFQQNKVVGTYPFVIQ